MNTRYNNSNNSIKVILIKDPKCTINIKKEKFIIPNHCKATDLVNYIIILNELKPDTFLYLLKDRVLMTNNTNLNSLIDENNELCLTYNNLDSFGISK